MKNLFLVCLLVIGAEVAAKCRRCGCSKPRPRPAVVAPAPKPAEAVAAPVVKPAPVQPVEEAVATTRSEEEMVQVVENEVAPKEVVVVPVQELVEVVAEDAALADVKREIAPEVVEVIEVLEAVEADLEANQECIPGGLIACKRALVEGEEAVAVKDMVEAMTAVMEAVAEAEEQMTRAPRVENEPVVAAPDCCGASVADVQALNAQINQLQVQLNNLQIQVNACCD
jgi:hypothetical protein